MSIGKLLSDAAARSFHDVMVKSVADYYQKNGYVVKADHIGWENGSPDSIGNFIPDVVALKGLEKLVVEIETEEGSAGSHCIDQLRAFSRIPNKVIVVVPKYKNPLRNGHINQLQLKLNLSGLQNTEVAFYNVN